MSALADLYAAQAAEARNRMGLTTAQTSLTDQEANEFGQTAAAKRALLGAQTSLTTNQASQVVPMDQSLIGLHTAQSGLYGAQAGVVGPEATSNLLTQGVNRGILGSQLGVFPDAFAPHFAAGTGDVPKGGKAKGGKGKSAQPKADTRTDTVPALLSPGEAVLNRGAAEHVGRGIIAHLNAIGLQRMAQQGLASPAPAAGGEKPKAKSKAAPSKGAPAKYAGGIADVIGRLFGHAMQQDSARMTGVQEANGGPVGLGGGVLDGHLPSAQPYHQIPFIYEPPVAATPAAAPAPAPAAPIDIVRGGRMTPGVQNFAAGVEEVFPLGSTMQGLDAGAAGGMPKKLAKGTSKVAKAKASKQPQAPFPMPTLAQVAPPATTMPQMSMPQAQIPSF